MITDPVFWRDVFDLSLAISPLLTPLYVIALGFVRFRPDICFVLRYRSSIDWILQTFNSPRFSDFQNCLSSLIALFQPFSLLYHGLRKVQLPKCWLSDSVAPWQIFPIFSFFRFKTPHRSLAFHSLFDDHS